MWRREGDDRCGGEKMMMMGRREGDDRWREGDDRCGGEKVMIDVVERR